MASKRTLLLISALCVWMLGVPAWQAQNSPAQDVLPQVEEQQVQQQPAQEMTPQEAQPQEIPPETAQPQAMPPAPEATTQEAQPQEMPSQEAKPQEAQQEAQPQAMPPTEMPPQESVTKEPPAEEPQAQENAAKESEEGGSKPYTAKPKHRGTANPESASTKASNDKPVPKEALTNPVLWHEPGDISSKDLFWGHGGPESRPQPPFTFVREILYGYNPKFDCRDANGKKWRVKLGAEARPEVVASRLLWAVGFYANDDYVLPRAEVRGLKMQRHSNKQRGNVVYDARFERKPAGREKIGAWRWKDNPFFGTREFNGLRVMMAVINNWDLKDANNAVLEARDHSQQYFLVSDVGSSFGTNTIEFPGGGSKGDPGSYQHSKFITRNDGVKVDFATPASPKGFLAKSVGFGAMAFVQHRQMDWIGNNIPVPDAHWIGTLLGQLSHKQLVDAFSAGNYPRNDIERFVTVLENRIHELQGL